MKVNRLIRIAYGPFALGDLAPGAVEEVGPRVIREQLGHLIAPANLPTGDRPLWHAPKPPASVRRSGFKAPPEPPKRKIYKPGWARPKAATVLSGGAARPRSPRPGGAAEKGARRPR